MKKGCLGLFLMFLTANAFAHDLSLKYSNVSSKDQKTLDVVMAEVSGLLPQKLKEGLPKDIIIKVEALTKHTSIPDGVCSVETVKNDKKKGPAFIYGNYNQYKNTLTINTPVLLELEKGRAHSKAINCQHKSLYDQSVATLVHELTHAFDFNNGRISNSMEYINRAGFKKGLLKIKNKNVKAMRSADAYELVNIAESFAVNMEYFAMDPEFACRKPSMFNYFKNLFGSDPYPTRNCRVSNTIMMSTQSGYIPTDLDPSRVYRIDYLVASAGKGLSSGFGHSMFRIVYCAPERLDPITNRVIPATPYGKKCLEDRLFHMVVSYRANVEDATLNYLKGLFGGYPSMLFILNFSDVLDEYNRDELRDVIAYPLSLSAKERDEFVLRVKEEHWNYRGSYKFITNNCATESYDLLKSALERSQLNSKHSVTPNGVLEDLDKLTFLDAKSSETEIFKSKVDQIVLAYQTAYGYKLKDNTKKNKAEVQKFIDESTADQRMEKFRKFQKTKIADNELNTEVALLKERLVAASSFSVMEQQILRTLALKYRKQAADMFMNTKDEKVKEVMKETSSAFAQSFTSLSNNGYGIPFADEMVSKEDLLSKIEDGADAMEKAETLLRELMPNEFATLEKINKNVQTYNMYSLQVRKEFRAKLDLYINQVLKNLTKEDFTKEIMINAAGGDLAAIKKVRELLGADLVTEKEILDSKLRKLIQDLV